MSRAGVFFLLLLTVTACAPSVRGVPVTVDTVTTVIDDAAAYTLSHPVDAAGRLLLVAVQYVEDSDSSSSVTADGLPLTLVGAITQTSKKPRVELWQIFNPPVDTAEVLVTVADAHNAKAAVAAITLLGVDPDRPIDTCITKAAKSTSGSIVISSEQADLVLAEVASLANGEPSPSVGSSELWLSKIDADHYGIGTSKPGSSSVNIGWALTESKEWAALAANINHKNYAPVLGTVGSILVTEGDTLSVTIIALDEDGTIPTLIASPIPKDAKFKDNGDGTGTLTFITDQTSQGVYPILFVASDGFLADSQMVTITVDAANVPPVLNGIGPQSVPLGSTLELVISATDADGTSPTFSMTPAMANAVLTDNGNGTALLTFAPTAGQIGVHEHTFIASDGILADSELVEISVVDTTQLAYIRIERYDGSPLVDSSLTTDDSLTLYCRGYRVDSSQLGDIAVTWSVLGADSIATLSTDSAASTSAQFHRIGTGMIVAAYSIDLADTTGSIYCAAGRPYRIEITPDDRTIELGDTIQFSATAYDADSNLTEAGNMTWSLWGHIGEVDQTGLFASSSPGFGRVSVATDRSSAVDTANSIIVEALLISPLALGTSASHAGDRKTVLLAFSIGNYYEDIKTVTSLRLRDCSRGVGTRQNIIDNIDSIAIYLDRDESYYDVSNWDTAIVNSTWGPDSTFTLPCSLTVDPGGESVILLAASISDYPHDGDSLDFQIVPSVDVVTLDSTVARGPHFVNSFGYHIIDGMTARQIAAEANGNSIVVPAESLYLAATMLLPKNGYAADSLSAVELINTGTASTGDIDSVLLFADDGDGVWSGAGSETALGPLIFTGENWSLSGIALPLVGASTRLFVAVRLTQFPGDGRTINIAIPVNGLRVKSGNDGPLDVRVTCPDTLTIQGREAIALEPIAIPSRTVIPGLRTGPLQAVKLTNGYALAVNIDTLAYTFTGSDPQGASPSALASQIDSVFLYSDRDNNVTVLSSADSLLAAGVLNGSTIAFSTPGLRINGVGGECHLVVAAKLSLRSAKNGNTIAFTLPDSAAIVCNQAVRFTGSFPITNPTPFTVDAFPAAAVTVQTLPAANLYAGQIDRPVFSFDLPRNGYASDKLTQIDLTNRGSLSSTSLLKNVRLWGDVTNNGFTADDQLLGEFKVIGSLWRLSDLRAALNAVQTRFIVTVSIADEQFDGGTLQFRIPMSGLQYLSGTTGPDDANVTSPTSFLVFPSNRVTVVSIPDAVGTILPGSANNRLMTFALYNGYVGQRRTLNQVTFANNSITSGSASFADHSLGQLSLYWDANKNRIFDNDPLIGTGLFTSGTLRLDGLSTSLAPESLAYFFVCAAAPLDLIDGDSLSVQVPKATDFGFKETVALNGDLPLASRQLVVDGSVRAQYRIAPLDGRSLMPGDSGIVLLAFSPAANGPQTDVLHALTLQNLGTADTSSISDLTLWHDIDGDGALGTGDTVLTTLSYSRGNWTASGLAISVPPTSTGLLVSGRVTDNALPDATVQISVPLSGCEFESSNDGPIDSAIVSPGLFTISNSPLRVALSPLRSSYSVGQTIDVAIVVSNVSANPIGAVVSQLVGITNPAAVQLDSASSGPITLAAGQSFTSHHYFTTLAIGNVAFRLRARSQVTSDSSVTIQTPVVTIQQAISPAALRITNAGPTAVTKGQTNVFPLTIECRHPDTGRSVAAMSLKSMRIRITDANNLPIPASTLFSRMVIATGFEILSVVQSVPADSDVEFPFVNPVIIQPGATQNFMFIADISAAATASNFRVSLENASWVPLHDNNTGQIIPHAQSIVYPITTAATRIDIPSQQIAVSAASCALATTNYGQPRSDMLKLSLRHTGEAGSSAVQLTSIALVAEDSEGAAIPASELFSRVSFYRQSYLYGETTPAPGDTTPLMIYLSTPLTLNAQESDSILISVSTLPSTSHTGFRLAIVDSTYLTARDLNTGAPLAAVADTSPAAGTAFPMQSSWTSFRMPAEELTVCPSDITVGSVAGGADAVPIMAISISYPVSTIYSAVLLNQIRVRVTDSSNGPIAADQLFEHVDYRIDNGSLSSCDIRYVGAGYVDFLFGNSGITVIPGDTFTVRLIGDLNMETSANEFISTLAGPQDIATADASDRHISPGVAQAQGCTVTYPFSTAPTSILLPAGRPVVSRTNLPLQIAAAGSQSVVLFDGAIAYNSTSALGRIELQGLTVALSRRAPGGTASTPVSQMIDAVHLELNGVEAASDTLLTNDTIALVLNSPMTVSRGDNIPVRITCDISTTANPGNVAALFCDSTFMTVVDKSLLTPIYPVFAGQTYPIKAGELSIVAASLENSFTNYPNPFNPARGATTIGFVLTEDAKIDIELFTLTGESVLRLSEQSLRAAGTYQSDLWTGQNGDGRVVQPGVYYCQITATYSSGRVASFRRKVAVIR